MQLHENAHTVLIFADTVHFGAGPTLSVQKTALSASTQKLLSWPHLNEWESCSFSWKPKVIVNRWCSQETETGVLSQSCSFVSFVLTVTPVFPLTIMESPGTDTVERHRLIVKLLKLDKIQVYAELSNINILSCSEVCLRGGPWQDPLQLKKLHKLTVVTQSTWHLHVLLIYKIQCCVK